ncbi:MAG: PilZ domain-containing protein [Pseudomonadota bacterium]
MNGPNAAADNNPLPDLRRATRRKTLKGGKLLFDGGTTSIECTIRNLSDTGAKLETLEPADLPEKFLLVFLDGREQAAKRVWQSNNMLGVAFIDESVADQDEGGPVSVKTMIVEQIVALEKSLAELRREVLIHMRE